MIDFRHRRSAAHSRELDLRGQRAERYDYFSGNEARPGGRETDGAGATRPDRIRLQWSRPGFPVQLPAMIIWRCGSPGRGTEVPAGACVHIRTRKLSRLARTLA
jgi:hypothetical protein